MTWKDLTSENIERIKQLYIDYLVKIHSFKALSFEDFIEGLEQCSMCGEYELSANMFDTEGMIDGGIGLICPDCRNNI